MKKFGLFKIISKEVIDLNFNLLKSDYRKTLFSRPCIYGVFSGRLGGFNPIKEKCVGCMRCVLEYPDTCQVDINSEFTSFMDEYWLSDRLNNPLSSPLNTIWYEAETGKIMVRGMGYKGQFGVTGWDQMYTDMSEIVRPTRDGVYGREFISTQVDIGRRSGIVNPLQINEITVPIPIPIIFDVIPNKISSPSIKESIAKTVAKIGTLIVDGGTTSDNSILFLTDSNFSEFSKFIDNYRIVEYFGESIEKFGNLKKEHPKTVMLYRRKLNENSIEIAEKVVSLGLDGIHLIADYHGNDYSSKSEFIQSSLHKVHQSLVEKGIRDKISIIASGGINQAEHVPKAIMSGADAVAIDIVTLIALQVKITGKSNSPENMTISMKDFDVNWGTQRLVNLINSWYNQLIEIMSAMGIKDVRRLRGEMGRAILDKEIREVAFDGIEQID